MEPRIWLTSDWHLGHDREFIWKARGFNSVEDMNWSIINKHNSRVLPDDDVYVLGDLTLGPATNIELIEKMNGKLHIVRGNHDTDARWALYLNLPNVVEMKNAIYLKYKQHYFYMSHYPSMTGNLEKESLKQTTINLYGHTHQKDNFYLDMPFMYHVGIDSHFCLPVCLDDAIKEMYAKVEECKDLLYIEEERNTENSYRDKFCHKCSWEGIKCYGPMPWSPDQCPIGRSFKQDP